MRNAFVIRLGFDSRPTEGFFEGWVEEVDSCTELRFHSTDELLKFLGRRFEPTITSTGKSGAQEIRQNISGKKNICRKRKSPEER
jgi:hypothetical protein